MDTILNNLLTRVRALLHRAAAYVMPPGPGGFEYLASVVLYARLEATQHELAKQDELLAETVAECDRAVADAAALSRETIGLHLQIDDLRQRVPDQDVLQHTREALEASKSALTRRDKLLAVTADERDGAMAQVSALSREAVELRGSLEQRDAQVADLTAALADSERRAAAAGQERDRLQAALIQAETASRVVSAPPATAPVPTEEPEPRTEAVLASVAPPTSRNTAARTRGASRKEPARSGEQRQEVATH